MPNRLCAARKEAGTALGFSSPSAFHLLDDPFHSSAARSLQEQPVAFFQPVAKPPGEIAMVPAEDNLFRRHSPSQRSRAQLLGVGAEKIKAVDGVAGELAAELSVLRSALLAQLEHISQDGNLLAPSPHL